MAYKKFSGGTFFKFDEEGKFLEGKWGGTKPGKVFKGTPTTNGIIFDEEGERHVFGLSAALGDMVYIPVGTQVKITFKGMEKTKDGTQYKGFDIDVDEDMVPLTPGSDDNDPELSDDRPPF